MNHSARRGIGRVFVAATLLFAVGLSSDAQASDGDTYIFYLHGRIIENEGTTPTHKKFGLYDYPAIVEALGTRGDIVVSETRGIGTKVNEYAKKTIKDIEKLIVDGISPAQIVVVGFSKGGGITIRISELLDQPTLRYVLLAACADWIKSYPKLHLTGSVLSVVETSDDLGKSCSGLASRGNDVVSFEEITLSTGKQHGAFYLPDPVWVDPVLDWIHGDEN